MWVGHFCKLSSSRTRLPDARVWFAALFSNALLRVNKEPSQRWKNWILWIYYLSNVKDEFFSFRKSGRFITDAPEKVFAQTYFEGIDEGSGNRKWKKMSIFFIFWCFNRNLTSESDWTHHFRHDTNIFVWIRHILENKNITSSGCYHWLRLTSVFSDTSGYRIETTYQATMSTFFYALGKSLGSILSWAVVMERPDLLNEKKSSKQWIGSDKVFVENILTKKFKKKF